MSYRNTHNLRPCGAFGSRPFAFAALIALAATPACTRSNASSDKSLATAQRAQPVAMQSQTAQPPGDLSPEAADAYREAQAGNVPAMVKLAEAYEKGEGAPKDLQQAFRWFSKASDAGDGYAMYRVGGLYATGSGVPKSEREALDWYRKAAAAGNADAMYDVGRAYESGSGVQEDVQEAVDWYTKAYRHGNQTAKAALVRLGEGYEDHP